MRSRMRARTGLALSDANQSAENAGKIMARPYRCRTIAAGEAACNSNANPLFPPRRDQGCRTVNSEGARFTQGLKAVAVVHLGSSDEVSRPNHSCRNRCLDRRLGREVEWAGGTQVSRGECLSRGEAPGTTLGWYSGGGVPELVSHQSDARAPKEVHHDLRVLLPMRAAT